MRCFSKQLYYFTFLSAVCEGSNFSMPFTMHFGVSFLNIAILPRRLSGKEPVCQCRRCKRCRFNPWVGKIPWSRKWQPTPVFLPGRFHGQRSLVGYSPWGCKGLDVTEQLCTQPEGTKCYFMMVLLCISLIANECVCDFICMRDSIHSIDVSFLIPSFFSTLHRSTVPLFCPQIRAYSSCPVSEIAQFCLLEYIFPYLLPVHMST